MTGTAFQINPFSMFKAHYTQVGLCIHFYNMGTSESIVQQMLSDTSLYLNIFIVAVRSFKIHDT